MAMSSVMVHTFDTPWTSTDPAHLQVNVDQADFVQGTASNLLVAAGGAAGASARYAPAAPIDLSAFDELRFWIRCERLADGSLPSPFFLELSYADAGDGPNELHQWFVPVDGGDVWEQRRIGIENDRRSAVTVFGFRCLDNGPFTCRVDELLAVHDEMLADLEGALSALLGAGLAAPVLIETPPTPTPSTSPAIILTALGPCEDLERSPVMVQRDSFRRRGPLTMCSVRPGARAYCADYQINVIASTRTEHVALMDELLSRLSMERGLRINGVQCPVSMQPAPALRFRTLGTLGPVYVRVGTRLETAPRQEHPWVVRTDLSFAPIDRPTDREGIVLTL